MNNEEFNEKYKDYCEPGHYGLEIKNEKVIEYLDELFSILIKNPHFSFSQIKLKFGYARVYMQPYSIDTQTIENEINKIIKNGN